MEETIQQLDKDILIETPLIELTKSQILQVAANAGIGINLYFQ